MKQTFNPFDPDAVNLTWSPFHHRFGLNRNYVMSLKPECLLQNFYLEAGLTSAVFRGTNLLANDPHPWGEDWHWGWESPTCQLRGHFTGHWLSAAARIWAVTKDAELKIKMDRVVDGIGACQKKNGGEWCGPIPEKFLEWTAGGQPTWAPHYVIHKLLMGLIDAHVYGGSTQALEILRKLAGWFTRWTGKFSREQMDNLLDVETGGMMESWANLYGLTGNEEHLELMKRYERRRLFQPLLDGKDAMTNVHANTTVPEAHGPARAYEVTGDARWRQIVEAYWRCAVTDRGYYCTGGQTLGEVWTPPHQQAARLGEKNQEYCVVYNMIRLAEYLLRWTGEAAYADYIERNLYNGILAQQHPGTGMIAYFLPLEAGGQKKWGSPTNDFWCCHGSLVQAHTLHNSYIYYHDGDGLAVAQYIPSRLAWEHAGQKVTLNQSFDSEAWTASPTREVVSGGVSSRPTRWIVDFTVECEKPVELALKFRMPWWLPAKAKVTVDGKTQEIAAKPSSYHTVKRTWKGGDKVRLELPKGLWTCPLDDEPQTVAFMDGPAVLAGLCDCQRTLHGDQADPSTILKPDKEREWGSWQSGYRTVGQDCNFRFKPLHEVVDERYTVYFPVRPKR